MNIIRIPKKAAGATLARLRLSKGSHGRIKAIFKIEGSMSAFMDQREYESARDAEDAAVAQAEQRSAVCLIIEDHT